MSTKRIVILLSTIIFSVAKAERYISPSPGNLFLFIEIVKISLKVEIVEMQS